MSTKISASPKNKELNAFKQTFLEITKNDTELSVEDYNSKLNELKTKFRIYVNGVDIDKLGAADLRITNYLVYRLGYPATIYLSKFTKYF